ncbi:alpha/beta hydrolase [Modestobacter sp. Leaf380]|uniref:alpha/beta hydrolase n=1 Tax=Modestobacter sp. Leaf380 TaxID=1736356 RepID=UPI0006FCF56D|nr:alpha/beta hydrolase [Modestobacter sp. Leaf380]KQS68617.1 hypothetical protein ASG41_06695 [Modestobacter sp. Leaf380]
MSGPVGLAAIESWDLPALQTAVGGLSGVPESLGAWRVRVDSLAELLRSTPLWSGPAADVAATALVELSTTAGRVQAALAGSADSLGVVVTQAGAAQEAAASARGWAASGPVALSDDGLVPPIATAAMAEDQLTAVADREHAASRAEGHAREAFTAAAAVLAAAGASAETLVVAGVGGAGPVGFGDVAAAAAAAVSAPPVPHVDPTGAATWWSGLSTAEQQAAIVADPAGVGRLEGLPAWARDEANRSVLAATLADPTAPGLAEARATAAQLAVVEAAGQTAQLLLFDPVRGLTALSAGDLDTAQAVGVLVPGMLTSVTGDLDGMTGDALSVQSLAQAAAPGLAVATVAWLGYETPHLGNVLSPRRAVVGGPDLDRALDGLAASRAAGALASGPALPRTTLVAHSYGTLVAGEAARADGELAADALILLGSPGVGAHEAGDLEADEVFGAWTPFDPVSTSDWYQGSPFDAGFGDTALPTTPVQLHTEYYSPWFPTVEAIAEVVAGTRRPD